MSFEALTPPAKAAAPSEPVRVSVLCRGETAPSRLTLVIRGDVLDQIDKKKKRTFSVLLGKAEDKHLIRLVAGEEGLFKANEMKFGKSKAGNFRIVLPPHTRWPSCRIAAKAASYETTKDGGLNITLPAWAWDDKAKIEIEKRAGARGGKA